MNISSLNFAKIQKVNFKGNTNSSNPIAKPAESLQNNGPEFKISPETYMSMFATGVVNNMEQFDVSSESETEFDIDDLTSPEFSANMALSTLKTVAKTMGAYTPEAQKAPVFMKFDYNNYITNLENAISQMKEEMEGMDIPDFEEMMETFNSDEDYIEELSELDGIYEENEQVEDDEERKLAEFESMMQFGLAMMPSIIKQQEALLEQFKTTKAQDVKKILNDLSAAHNLMFLNVLKNGSLGNARGVVGELTSNVELYAEPEITDNNVNTLTYTYFDMAGAKTEITKNKANGDYISASSRSLDGKKGFDLQFNPNGSIKKLDYINNIDNSIVSISQNENKFTVRQIFNGVITERRFIDFGDGNIKQTSMQVFMKG